MIYRLVLRNTGTVGSPYNTGANYPGCSLANQGPCDPKDFQTMNDVLAYAQSKGETVVLVASEDRAWAIVNGAAPNSSEIVQGSGLLAGIDFSNPWVLAGAVFLVWKLIR
jgi:hypothetical protein